MIGKIEPMGAVKVDKPKEAKRLGKGFDEILHSEIQKRGGNELLRTLRRVNKDYENCCKKFENALQPDREGAFEWK